MFIMIIIFEKKNANKRNHGNEWLAKSSLIRNIEYAEVFFFQTKDMIINLSVCKLLIHIFDFQMPLGKLQPNLAHSIFEGGIKRGDGGGQKLLQFPNVDIISQNGKNTYQRRIQDRRAGRAPPPILKKIMALFL